MPNSQEYVPLRDAAQIIDTLNEAVEVEGIPQRSEFLLRRQQRLLNRDTRCTLALLGDLDRDPSPRVLKRFAIRPAWEPDLIEDLPVQEVYDKAVPVTERLMPGILANIRTPYTCVLSSDLRDGSWFQDAMLNPYLAPAGYADIIISMWAASKNNAVCFTHFCRTSDAPFGDSDRMLLSLMMRAVAPMIDREMFRFRDMPLVRDLSPRQRDILLLLLTGDSEKEIAEAIGRSVPTVHTIVGQLYKHFDVTSRGALMALFVDKAMLQALEVGKPTRPSE